ncbi:MAG: TRASH domain-containing protein [Thermoplasmata archaeon]
MEKLNITPNESKVLRILSEDSRISINEISEITGLNRNTVRKIIIDLKKKGIIKKFTIELDRSNQGNTLFLEVEDLSVIPEEYILEIMKLANGNYMVLCSQEILNYDIKYRSINIVKEVFHKNFIFHSVRIYCDYCGKEIRDIPIVLTHNKRVYYACCHNCERDLQRRFRNMEYA